MVVCPCAAGFGGGMGEEEEEGGPALKDLVIGMAKDLEGSIPRLVPSMVKHTLSLVVMRLGIDEKAMSASQH